MISAYHEEGKVGEMVAVDGGDVGVLLDNHTAVTPPCTLGNCKSI